MLLAGDIGGTKTTLALFTEETGLTPQHKTTYSSMDYTGLAVIVQRYRDEVGEPVDSAVFGVAGPVIDGEVSATNLAWTMGEESLRAELGLRDVKLLNDLEATAHGVPHLPEDELYILNDAPPQSGTKAVLAPGTGLGEAVLMVAGASGNLGQAMARAFYAAGANLVLLDRAPDRLPSSFPSWPARPTTCCLAPWTPTDAESVERAVQRPGALWAASTCWPTPWAATVRANPCTRRRWRRGTLC
jgi:hypothetical protein